MASHYTPPPGLALDDLAERIAARVVDMYSQVEAELLAEVARRLAKGIPVEDFTARLRVVGELQATARRLLGRIPPDLAAQVVAVASERGVAAAVDALALTAGMPRVADLTASQASTLALVAADLGNAFEQLHLRILRYPIDAVGQFIGTDVYQQTVAAHVGTSLVGGFTFDEVRKRVLADFLDQGVTGFTDRLGRRWRIGSYTEMAVRSATGRAFNDAKNHRMAAAGITLVSVLGNNDACRLCAPWFGKVLSIDGTLPGRYQMQHATDGGAYVDVVVDATLEQARADGLMHPNCACTTAPYHPGLSVLSNATRFDPVAAEGRDRQRALERSIRDLKRKRSVAAGVGDTAGEAKWSARIREKQKQVRDLLDETGQKRRYDREQERWADGPSSRPARATVPDVDVPPAPDRLVPGPARVRLLLDEGPTG